MLLHFQDPSKLRTKQVIYEQTYYARDSGTLEQLKDLTTKRKAIEESINGISNITPAIAREMAGGITSPILQNLQKLEKYVPLLENLVRRIYAEEQNAQIIQWTIDLKLRWTSVMSGPSGSGLRGPKYFRVDDLRYELTMMLFLYASLLRERANEVLRADLVDAASLYRRAAGVFLYLAEELLPGLLQSLPSDRPPEVTPSMAKMMSLICLAEAQAVTVQKAEQNLASRSLLAKLNYGIAQFLEEAINVLRLNTSDWNDISDKFKRFIYASCVLHEAKCWRYVAADLKSAEQLGAAVGVLRHAVRKVQQIRPPSDDISKMVFQREIDALTQMLRQCEHENDFIWREKPLGFDELPRVEGKKIVTPIAYKSLGLDRDLIFVI